MNPNLLKDTQANKGEVASEEEIALIIIQLVVSSIFLITTFISILLTIDLLQDKLSGKSLYTEEESKKIDLNNHTLVFILVLILSFVNIGYIDVRTKRGEDPKYVNTQFIISIITLIAAFMSLNLVKKQQDEDFNFSDIENPNI